ncbi:glyoxylate/hydroxypyruvate reductase A [Yangia mangrovi]|uniref:Glyoxylate/hydroxypyruvate reductase A n=2 Tax=Alloyangia mangrovi TaxID=1779329 RepID=A0ABT2KJN0_9RHOB|nr:glyoxylate/hydroxypyruvate reductase A [Alloyangia mangrovi]MCT4370469.1 glyoxylate/hydroxypyruvate reductase A [Alloyangia mangrovi]
MKGVIATTSGVDLWRLYPPVFGEHAPELTVLRPEDVADKSEVTFAFTFRPPDDLFEGMSNLKAIFSAGAGTDAIMACPSRPAHVPVFRVEDADQALQMAAFATFHVVWHHRDIGRYVAQQAHAEWSRAASGFSAEHRRVGVLGFGHMGRAIAKALVGLGYPVAGYARRAPEPAEPGVEHFHGDGLEAFLARTDILVNVLPLTGATQGMIDAALLSKLPQGAALVQIGRGGQVVEEDLLALLDAGHLSGASMDVFETEPLPREHPLWTHPRVLITPHVASIPEPRFVVQSIRERLSSL